MPLRLQVPFVSPKLSIQSSFATLDSIQGVPPAEQVAGVGVLFALFCDELGIDPSQLIDASRRRIVQASFEDERAVYGLKAYVRGEMR